MPFTPLHFGPGLLVREIIGHKQFGIWSFVATQIMLDVEPAVRMYFDLDGTLHQTTHNPLVGTIYALIAITVLWKWERSSAITGAFIGVVSHLWLDAIYHSDVAAAMARWGVSEGMTGNAELICTFSFVAWLLILGVRKAFGYGVKRGASRKTGTPDSISDNIR